MKNKRGYFGIGIFNVKTEYNIGTLWRSAQIMGASFIFTIGNRYKKQATDTSKAWRSIPLNNYANLEAFYQSMPYDCMLVGIELHDKSEPIKTFTHPERCIYLLGAEDSGLSNDAINKCHKLVQLPGEFSLNVSTAGSIVMYDRFIKTT